MADLLATYGPPSPELARRLVLLLGLLPKPPKAEKDEQPPAIERRQSDAA
jgi:hypothetical protein